MGSSGVTGGATSGAVCCSGMPLLVVPGRLPPETPSDCMSAWRSDSGNCWSICSCSALGDCAGIEPGTGVLSSVGCRLDLGLGTRDREHGRKRGEATSDRRPARGVLH